MQQVTLQATLQAQSAITKVAALAATFRAANCASCSVLLLCRCRTSSSRRRRQECAAKGGDLTGGCLRSEFLMEQNSCCADRKSRILSHRIFCVQVLFTIAKEKLNTSWKYAMAVLMLDVLQVCTEQHLSVMEKNPVRKLVHKWSCECSCWYSTWRTTFPGRFLRTTGMTALSDDTGCHMYSLLLQLSKCLSAGRFISSLIFSFKGLLCVGSVSGLCLDWNANLDNICRTHKAAVTTPAPFILQGELVYKIFFWLLTAVVVVSTTLCLFVAHNFKTNNFPYIW